MIFPPVPIVDRCFFTSETEIKCFFLDFSFEFVGNEFTAPSNPIRLLLGLDVAVDDSLVDRQVLSAVKFDFDVRDRRDSSDSNIAESVMLRSFFFFFLFNFLVSVEDVDLAAIFGNSAFSACCTVPTIVSSYVKLFVRFSQYIP